MAAAVATSLAILPASSAHAASTQQVCTTGSLVVCVNFALSGSGGSYGLTVTYVSTNGGGVLSAFGIDGLGSFNFTSTGLAVPAGKSWSFSSNCNLQDPACAESSPPPTQNGLTVGQSAMLTFTATGFTTDFGTNVFADAHVIGFTNQDFCSVKVSTSAAEYEAPGRSTAGGSTASGSFNGGSLCAPTTVPEPASMTLLGTGLMALAGLKVRRRRDS